MSGISVTSSHALAQTAYKTGLALQTETRALLCRLMGAESENPVFVMEESPEAQRGSTLVSRFQSRHRSPMPFGRASNVIGQGDTPTWYSQDVDIHYLGLAKGEIENLVADQNEVSFALKEAELLMMAQNAGTVIEASFIHQCAGYSPVNAAAYTVDGTPYVLSGCNAVTEPDAAHHFFAPGASTTHTAESTIPADPTAWLTSRFVNSKLAMLQSRNHVQWPFAPASTPWGEGYVLLTSLEGIDQVKQNSSDSDIYDLEKACIQGGMDPNNASLWTGEGFKINNVFYLAHDGIGLGTSGSSAGSTTAGSVLGNCQRSLLLGAGAGCVRFGENFTGGVHMGFEEFKALRRWTGIIDTVWGMTMRIVNGERWASAVFSHYSSSGSSTAQYS
jgi:hypothetical protein